EKIDDPNITMEEYVKLEEEKARRHSRTFNWQTAMFSKIKHYEDEDDYYINFETEFPAIVFDNTTIPSEPKGRKSRARLSGGNFIERLAMYFGLVSDEGLGGLQVAQGPERQQDAAAGALEVDKPGEAAEKDREGGGGGARLSEMWQACEELSRALPPSSLESPPG
nr:hypothetical protein [Tanacetum cinerariifolium]